MAYPSSTITVKVQLLDSAGSSIYVGSTSVALYVWGAQLELAEYYEDARADIDNYVYMQTNGTSSSHLSYRFGQDNNTDNFDVAELLRRYQNLLAHRAGNLTHVQIKIASTTSNAAQIYNIFYNQPGNTFGKRWFSDTPLYSSYVNLWGLPAQRGDNVTVGRLDSVNLDQVYDYNALSGSDDYDSYASSITVDFKYV